MRLDQHPMCVDYHGLVSMWRAILRPEVWCPEPSFDMGLCLECGRTTVDHLIDLNNATAALTLRGDLELRTARYFQLALDIVLAADDLNAHRD